MSERIETAAEFKFMDAEATARGEFVGYASTFGNMDLGGDIVEAGAFRDTITKRGAGGVAMLWGHDPRQPPIGKWLELREDDRGLVARGQLILDVAKARDVHALMREGALKGLSIGYRLPPGGAETDRRGVRRIKSADVHEISVVTFPMNTRAQVSRVKSVEELTTEEIREIEATLREKGLSRADAVKAVSGFKAWLQRDAEVPITTPRDEVGAATLAEIIRRNIATLT
jgi:HK97 family phage prohead protease